MELGPRIRSLRKENRLSLEQLAARSGVALATLSRIENGKGTGTFRTHQKIADALRIALPELYRGLESANPVVTLMEPKREEAETFTYDEKASAILLAKQASLKQMLPQLIILYPGGKTSLEQYQRGTERWIFGLKGAVQAIVGENRYRIAQGSTLYFQASLPHRFINPGSSIAKVISVASPAVL